PGRPWARLPPLAVAMDCSWARWALTPATGMSGAAAARGAGAAPAGEVPPASRGTVATAPAAAARTETDSFMWGAPNSSGEPVGRPQASPGCGGAWMVNLKLTLRQERYQDTRSRISEASGPSGSRACARGSPRGRGRDE